MLKNKLFRVIGLVAAICCLAGAAAGLTVFAVNDANANQRQSAVAASGPYTFTIEEPKGVRLKAFSSSLKTRWFSFYAGLTDSSGNEIEVSDSPKAQGALSSPFSSITYSEKTENKTIYNVTLAEGVSEVTFYYTIVDSNLINSVTFSVAEENNVEFGQEAGYCDLVFLEGDSNSCSITCEVKKPTYTLTFLSSVGANFASDNSGSSANQLRSVSVEAGGSYGFYLVASEEKYTLKEAKVYNGGEEIKCENGEDSSGTIEDTQREWKKYTLESVAASSTITFENVKEKTFTVTYPTEERQGFTVSGPSQVGWNGSVTFTVQPEDGKEVTKVSYKMGDFGSSQNLPISPSNTYTITPVTGNITVEVEVKEKSYSIVFPSDHPGYTIKKADGDNGELSGAVSAGHGALKFKIELNPGYSGNPTVTFVPMSGAGSSLSKDKDGIYTLDVTQNGTVNISGITQDKYTVAIERGSLQHYDYSSQMSNVGLTYGQQFIFTVEAHDGYIGNRYSVSLSGGSSSSIDPKEPSQKSTNTFTVTVKDNVTITLTEEGDDNRISYQVKYANSSHPNYTVKIISEEKDTDLDGKTTVKHGESLTFKVEAAVGYSVNSVTAVGAHQNEDGSYTISSVTSEVTISATVSENTLTLTYLNAAGGQYRSDSLTYSDLKKTGESDDIADGIKKKTLDPKTASGNTSFSYLVPEWWTTGDSSEEFLGSDILTTAAKTLESSNVSLTLRLHYTVAADKASELLNSFYAYYRDDTGRTDKSEDQQKKYFIFRMEIDGDGWKSFLNELSGVGANLSAVGFTYSNAPEVDNYYIDDYTENDISGAFSKMVDATADDVKGKGGKIEELVREDKIGSSGAWLWCFGYKWSSYGNQQNQVQFINTTTGSPRYFGGWFMFTLSGVSTVVQAKRTETTSKNTEKAPHSEMQDALPPFEGPSMDEPVKEEFPTIE